MRYEFATDSWSTNNIELAAHNTQANRIVVHVAQAGIYALGIPHQQIFLPIVQRDNFKITRPSPAQGVLQLSYPNYSQPISIPHQWRFIMLYQALCLEDTTVVPDTTPCSRKN